MLARVLTDIDVSTCVCDGCIYKLPFLSHSTYILLYCSVLLSLCCVELVRREAGIREALASNQTKVIPVISIQ